MASRIGIRSVLQRGLANQAATKKAEAPAKPQTSQLANGITVASLDSGNAISSVAVVVKTGSRHENGDNLGATQALRLAVGLATSKNSSFNTCMNIQQAGGKVDVTSSREYTLFTAQGARNAISEVVANFASVVDSPAFKPWELGDVVNTRMDLEKRSIDESAIASELLHQAAYRTGLGNSLYAPDYMVGKHTSAMLQDFHNRNYCSDRVVVLGLDVDHELAVKCGEALNLGKSTGGSPVASKFRAGIDERKAEISSATVFALATNAAPASNVKEAVATRLLQYILGFGPKIKRGAGQGQLQKAVANIPGALSVSALNYSYSDAGLIGAIVACEAPVSGKALETVVAALRSVNVTDEELARAKKSLLIDLEDQSSSSLACLDAIACNLSLGAKDMATPSQMYDMFANATLADVQAVAKKLGNAKFSMGSVGNVGNLPYIDEL